MCESIGKRESEKSGLQGQACAVKQGVATPCLCAGLQIYYTNIAVDERINRIKNFTMIEETPNSIKFFKMTKALCFVACILFAFVAKAQFPESFSYQFTVKDSDGKLVPEQQVGIRIRIINQQSKTLYEEKQNMKTNARAVASMNIGNGTNQVGSLGEIDWNNDGEILYIRADFDLLGGTNYQIRTNDRINSVPYAMFAKSVNVLNETDSVFLKSAAAAIGKKQIEKWDYSVREKHYPGDLFAGGVVFYVDSTGENGLLASTKDIAKNLPWTQSNTDALGADSFTDGRENTKTSVEQLGVGNYAANVCDTFSTGGKNDWYLPAIDELSLLFDASYPVNKALGSDTDNQTQGLESDVYWSSTEHPSNNVYLFDKENAATANKSEMANVRAVRRFSGLYDIDNYAWFPLLGPEEEQKSHGKVSTIIENENGDVLIDEDGKRGTVCRSTPEIKLPVKITFKLQTTFDPSASEEPTMLRGTGDFRLCFGGPPAGVKLDPISESNMGEYEGVQFRIHPHVDVAPIRVYTGTEPHTNTSIWLRYVDPGKLKDKQGLPITGLASDECQGRGNQCGWERVGLFENGFGLKNSEEALVTVIISNPEISISVKDRKWGVDVDDLLADDNDIVGDVLRFDRISYMSVSHTNISRGYETIRIADLKITPLK
jgi:hypothetical protein